jgi:hypothetical protein
LKHILNFLAVVLLNASFLYPLLWGGIGRHVSWVLTGAMFCGGVYCIYLLIRYRKEFRDSD